MIVFRAISFLLFLALAAALVVWQVYDISADLAASGSDLKFGVLGLALLLPPLQALVVRVLPRPFGRAVILVASIPALPLVAPVTGIVSLVQARGANHARTWQVAFALAAILSTNVLLPLGAAHLLSGGGVGLALGWMAIKAQFYLVANYFLGRALVHYFNSAASAFVSLRYLRKRVISLLSVLGIGVGVMVLILVNSVMSGFQTEFKQQVRGSLSHLLVKFDSARFQLDDADEGVEVAKWAEYVRRIEASPAIAHEWNLMLDRALGLFRARDGDGLPDAADVAKAQPAEEGPAPRAERTPQEGKFLERVRTGVGLTIADRACLREGDSPAHPRDFYLSRVPDRARAQEEADRAWYAPLFRARLQREFDDAAAVLREHRNPSGEPDVTGVSWRVSSKSFITPSQGNRELPFADLVGVDPLREPEISDLGRYVAAAEVQVFRNQYLLRPMLNLLGATLGWETPESVEALNATPVFIYTEDGKGMGRMPPDLRGTLARRGFVTGSGNVRWPLFNQVEFQEFSPARQLYERVKNAHQRAVRTEDIDELADILADCERDVRALLRKHMDAPEPTEPALLAARTGCRIIYQEYLTGIGVSRSALRLAHTYSVGQVKEFLQRPDVSEAERDLLQKLWAELDKATQPADEITNSHDATETQREEAVKGVVAAYRKLLAEYQERAKAVSPMAAEFLLILGAGMVPPYLAGDLLAQNSAVPLAFAAEKFAPGAELAKRRMEAYARALPLRTTLLPGESVDEYVKRAGEAGRTPGDGVREQGTEPGIILGDSLAESALLGRDGVRIGDVIEVAIPRVYFVQGRPDGRATYVKFRVTGLFHSGLYEDNMGRIYCDFDQLASVLSDSEVSYFVGAKLKDYSIYEGARADPLKREVENSLRKAGVGASRVSVWEDEKRTLLEAVEREKTILSLIVGFIIVLAGVLILILVYQLVNEKVKDIGILKALGHSPWGIRSVFMFNALFIGLFGALIGVGSGMLFSENLNEIEDFVDRLVGVRLFPPDVYFLTYIPSVKGEALLWLALGIGAPVVLFSFGCGILPAMIAARKDPVEALHYE